MCHTTERYNGWTNHQTWAISLWLTNDKYSDEMVREMAENAWKGAEADRHLTRLERATIDLSEMLRAHIEEMNPLADEASLFSDLMSSALSDVDWRELAENFLSDVEKEDNG